MCGELKEKTDFGICKDCLEVITDPRKEDKKEPEKGGKDDR
jgi:hypothetical protein